METSNPFHHQKMANLNLRNSRSQRQRNHLSLLWYRQYLRKRMRKKRKKRQKKKPRRRLNRRRLLKRKRRRKSKRSRKILKITKKPMSQQKRKSSKKQSLPKKQRKLNSICLSHLLEYMSQEINQMMDHVDHLQLVQLTGWVHKDQETTSLGGLLNLMPTPTAQSESRRVMKMKTSD